MIDFILQFRESKYWYICIILILTFLMFFLQKVKKESTRKHKRYVNILTLVPWAFLVLGSIILVIMVIYTGFSKAWLDNYMDLLLIIVPIIIFILIIYAVRKEKRQKESSSKPQTKPLQ